MREILIYDDIGPEWLGMVSAKGVLAELAAIPAGDPVTVRVNSPGGDVVEAQAIYNALSRQTGDVLVAVDGLAASAASYLIMAADKIEIAENAMLMVHKAWSFAMGNADDMRKTAGVLDKFDGVLLDAYAARSGDKKSRDELAAAMEYETWLNATEAVDWGLADAIGQPLKVAACIAPGRYTHTPAALLDTAAPVRARARRIEAARARLAIARAK